MAIDEMWYANLESRVFTMVSTAMQAYGLPVFYMFQNDTDEILMDLQNQHINGVLARFQCEAFAADEDTAKAIAYAGVMHMKKLGFECMFFPKVSLSRDGVVRVVARYKRPIGSGETIFTED